MFFRTRAFVVANTMVYISIYSFSAEQKKKKKITVKKQRNTMR